MTASKGIQKEMYRDKGSIVGNVVTYAIKWPRAIMTELRYQMT